MNTRIEDYIEAHIDPEPENLKALERATNLHLVNGRMCSGHLQGRLLKMLMQMIRPKRVLELGTFSGYSALCMAEGLGHDARIDTVEADDELEDFIRRALANSEHGEKVNLHISDAILFCRSCEPGSYDVVFIDADKRCYCEYYEACLPLVRPGGYIIADNTLWYGHVAEENGRRDPQTEGIRAFNELVAHDPRVETVMLPLRDGLTLMRLRTAAT